MKVGLSTLYCLEQPFSVLIRHLETIDVKNVEFVDEGKHILNESRVKKLKKIVKDRDLCTSVHAPFLGVNIAASSKPVRTMVLSRLEQSIQFSSELESSFWVFHPGLQTEISGYTPSLDWKVNLESIRRLLSFSEDLGVNLTVENGLHPLPFLMKTAEDFIRFFRDLDEPHLGLTLDVGHANVNNQIDEFFQNLPNKIVHAHLHDNHGKTDEHLGIGYGNLDWSKIARSFRKIDFKGTLVIESVKNVDESIEKLRALIMNQKIA